jgi:uncharacterized membrane protein YfcA
MLALALLAGAVAALSGFGIGSLLIPVVAISLGTKLAVIVVAMPHAAATALRLWLLRSAIDRAVLIRFGVPSAIGGLTGALLQAYLSSPVLSAILGALLVLAGITEFSGGSGRLRFPGRWSTLGGLLSGLFGGLVGNQGGIRSAALLHLGLSRETLVATATASALLVDAARVPVYVASSAAQLVAAWPLVAALTGGVLVGTVFGAPVLRRIPETQFRRLLALLLIALGVWLLAAGAAGRF